MERLPAVGGGQFYRNGGEYRTPANSLQPQAAPRKIGRAVCTETCYHPPHYGIPPEPESTVPNEPDVTPETTATPKTRGFFTSPASCGTVRSSMQAFFCTSRTNSGSATPG